MHDPYAAAGVDIEAGDKAVELMRAAVRRTHGPQVPEGIGGFAGVFDAALLKEYRSPYLVTSTDGVGTKVAIAQALDKHDTIGQDLVGMVVGDIAVVGAKPLFMTDYIACGKLVPARIAEIVAGVARACEETGCALLGGETAEHPGLMAPEEYDLAGAVTGVVEADQLLGPNRVKEGDLLIGVASSGLHANGFSLVRSICAQQRIKYTDHWPDLGCTFGEAFLTPTRLYVKLIQDLMATCPGQVHAISHITGGGISGNLVRIMPPTLAPRLNPWPVPPLFRALCDLAGLQLEQVERTWNLGIGLVIAAESQAVVEAIPASWQPQIIGQVVSGNAVQWAGNWTDSNR